MATWTDRRLLDTPIRRFLVSQENKGRMTDTITALEIRNMGLTLPDSIPDCATTLRSGMTWDSCTSVANGDKITLAANVSFIYPFEWVVGEFTINEDAQ